MSIVVVMEQRAGAWNKMSWETLAAGQQLASELHLPLIATFFSDDVDALATGLATRQVSAILPLQHALLKNYTADGYAVALEHLVRLANPRVVLFPHTYQVRDFAPKVTTRFNQVLISDVVGMRVEDGAATYVRQLFQGKLNADVKAAGNGPHFVSIQAGAYRADRVESGQAAETKVITPELSASQIRQRPEDPFRESARAVDLTAADIIVSVGRGIKEKENISLIEDLAKALGGELAASRPICDSGWLPMERQVGSSGQTVSPKVYMAVGISGAIQHLVGMKGAKTIVAINKDANAPIFEVADYGIVGDLFEVVPALIEEVKKARA